MKRREGGRNITEKNIQGQHQSHLGADSGHGDQLLVLGFLYILTLIRGTLKKKKKGLNVLCTKDCDISFFFTFIVLPFVSLYVSLVHSDDNSKRCISLSVTVHANAAPDIVEKDALTLRSLLDITCFTERVEGTLTMRGDFFLIN